jgi:conjugal transfer pilus assembly protein TraW
MIMLSKKKVITLFAVMAIWLIGQPVIASVHNLGVLGATYSIAERDALEEIQERAKAVDWAKALNREKAKERIKSYRPRNLSKLPSANLIWSATPANAL